MDRRWIPTAVVLVAVTSAAAVATTPVAGTVLTTQDEAPAENSAATQAGNIEPLDRNGLSEVEAARLFNQDVDREFNQTHPVMDRLEINESARMKALKEDYLFPTPTATAREWTTTAFTDYDAGAFEKDSSRHPQHAELTTEGPVADAHVTLFQLQPSTIAHEAGDEATLYVAEQGDISAMVDYRERTPPKQVVQDGASGVDRRVTTYEIQSSQIENVSLLMNREVVKQDSGEHLPEFTYSTGLLGENLNRLGIQANITVVVEEETTTYYEDGSEPSTTVTTNTTTVTVVDGREVTPYDLEESDLTMYRGDNPDNGENLGIRATKPWASLRIDGGPRRLLTRWGFVTARTPGWETLTITTEGESNTRPAPDLPVYVHAVPTPANPRAADTESGVAGSVTTRSPRYPERAPPETVPEEIRVRIINESYLPHGTIGAQYPSLSHPYAVEAVGLVNRTGVTMQSSTFTTRSIRQSEVVLETREQNDSHTVIFVQVQDTATGEPVSLQSGEQRATPIFTGVFPSSPELDRGQVVIRSDSTQRTVQPGANGTTVALQDHGMIFARFEPAPWTAQDPAYLASSASARSLPGGSIIGVLAPFLMAIFGVLVPMWLAYKFARSLGRIIHPEDHIQ